MLLIALMLNPVFHWVWHPAWLLWPFYLGNYARFIWLSDFLQNTSTIDLLRSSLPFHPPLFMYFGHFWSLCIEEQFYLVWPLVIFLVRDRVRLRNICIAVCSLSLATRIACVYLVPQPYLDAGLLGRLTPLCADSLMLGGLLALVLRGPEAHLLDRVLRYATYLAVASLAIFQTVFLLRLHHLYYPDIISPVLSTFGFTVVNLLAALLILHALEPTSFLYRLLILKPLRRLGQMSYGFYVFHDIPHRGYEMLVLHIFGSSWHMPALIAAVALVCTLILSYLSFRFFESPFLRLKDRFTL
jgi:peptidoglycan/LPS O-acetylase OafA/YrhL